MEGLVKEALKVDQKVLAEDLDDKLVVKLKVVNETNDEMNLNFRSSI